MAIEDGGARCFMASYNAVNKVPDTVQPAIRDVAMKMWGLDGIVSTDAGSLPALVRAHHYFTNEVQAAVASLKAGINQFIDRPYLADLTTALSNNLVTEADIDQNIKGELRVFIRLGLVCACPGKSSWRMGDASFDLTLRFDGRSKREDFHHVAKTGVASPHTFKPGNAVTLAIQVSTQLSDQDRGLAEGAFCSGLFFYSAVPAPRTRWG
jgi:hypothetical protein